MASQPPNTSARSSSEQPLRLKKRPDLIATRQQYQGRDYWVVKDPLSLKYYRFEEEEYALLQMIDGVASPDQIKRRFDFQFAPQKILMQELYQFVGMLYRSALLVSEAPDQGVELLKRGEKRKAQERTQALTNILAIRFRGFDPDNLLSSMNQHFGWFFSWPAFVVVLLLWVAAGGLILAQFEQFQNKLPSFQSFFAASNWIWLALVIALTKVVHEFGHGLACKRFGGQCHEMGLMLLVLTPCLYVNVSDSWLLNNKWHRAMIAAAGMYVEFILASIAVFVWWFTAPGIVNQLALNVVFVSSVSTLLFNANPLLRYDGYYILSDLLEIPNLRSKATTILQRTAGSLILGIESRRDPFLPARHQWLFGLYSVCAAIYRWFITLVIFWFVYNLLEPYGLKIIGQLVAMMAIYGLIGAPFIQLYKFFSTPGRLGTVKPVRATISAVVLATILIGILWIPIPHYVYCDFYAQPANAKKVYVDVPGVLAEIYAFENEVIQEGNPIIRLHSQRLRVQLASLRTDAELAGRRLNNLKQISNATGQFVESVKAAQTAQDAAIANFDKRLLDEDRLVIRAPNTGLFLAPPRIEPESDPTMLPQWTGTPVDTQNLGCYLDSSTLVGTIVPDPSRLEAVIAVDQADMEFVAKSQRVEFLIFQIPGRTFQSSIEVVTPTEMESAPNALSSRFGGNIVTESIDGKEVPKSTKYIVRAPLSIGDFKVVSGATGQAKIRVGTQTIGQRMLRLINRTIQFDL